MFDLRGAALILVAFFSSDKVDGVALNMSTKRDSTLSHRAGCMFSTPAGTFDLAPLGTIRALSPTNEKTLGWLFLFNICEKIDPEPFAPHCAGVPPAPALGISIHSWCRTIGRMDHRIIKELSGPGTTGIAISYQGGDAVSDDGADACGSLFRSISIDVVCADVGHPPSVQFRENLTRPCGYLSTVRSRTGCPLECARDPLTGSVCGGNDHGECKSVGGATASCVCRNGYSGPHCGANIKANINSAAEGFTLHLIDPPLALLALLAIIGGVTIAFLFHSGYLQISAQSQGRRMLLACLALALLFESSQVLEQRGFPRDRQPSGPHGSRPPAQCAFASVGGTFRLGGQNIRVQGAIESYDDQIAATRSHMALLQTMWREHGLVCDIFFITYNHSFVRDLEAVLSDAWPHRLALFRVLPHPVGWINLYEQVLEAALPIATLNATPYDVLHYIRADMRLKPYFSRAFDPLDEDRILFASFTDNVQATDRRGHGKGRPWVNELALSVPRKYFSALRPGNAVLQGQHLHGHGTLNWLMEVVPWNSIGAMVPTCEYGKELPVDQHTHTPSDRHSDHSGVSDSDWMPLWNIVGRGATSFWKVPGLCIHPVTFAPIPVGPECATKSAYDTFIEGCLRRASKRPCLCSCGEAESAT